MDFAEERPTDRHYRHTDLSRFASLLKPGRNVVAVHADSDEARRAVDVGFYTLD
jgi:hypothetical protein